jgi:hypothetical protein
MKVASGIANKTEKSRPLLDQSDPTTCAEYGMIKMAQMLGNGIYTLREAALYARVSSQMIARWLFGSQKGKGVVAPQFPDGEQLVSFLDLVQTLAIREIRLQRKIPLPKIRQAIKIAKEAFQMDYPFARHHVTYLLGDELVIRPTAEEYIEASGSRRGQRLFHFVEMYLDNLTFDRDGLARLYKIYEYEEIAIVMKPEIKFGEPMLPSGYSAMALWDSIRSEGGIEQAAKVYGIPKEEVAASYKFFVDFLGKSAA